MPPSPSAEQRHVGTVYLLHFSGRTKRGHQHYLGWSSDVVKRFNRHRAGLGANEVRKALSEGLKITLAQSWPGTLADERRIKDECKRVRRGFACLCPYCDVDDERAGDLLRGMGPPTTLRVVRAALRADYAAADDLRSARAS
jgi:predicted GIY-YIG superfamily endonuclease